MIFVVKDYSTLPEKFGKKNYSTKVIQLITEGIDHNFDKNIYNKYCINELMTIYKNKCCYCESKPLAVSYFEVDHYRPKLGKESDGHNGYYWLAYEWSNLLLACKRCNNKKLAQFPILGQRVDIAPLRDGLLIRDNMLADSRNLLEEQPLLLNPEIDFPENFIIVLPNGNLRGFDDESRGEESIRICELNREGLITARFKILDDYFDDLKNQLTLNFREAWSIDTLIAVIESKFAFLRSKFLNTEEEYSLVWSFLFWKFNEFVDYHINTPDDNAVIKRLWSNYLEKILT